MITLQLLLAAVFAANRLGSASVVNRPLPRSWSNRLGSTMTPITTGVWAIERPFFWNGIDVGSRSVVCRMSDGSLLVHSPLDATDGVRECIDALGGEVQYVISPNYEHLKYAKQWHECYPRAIKIGPPGIGDKVPEVNWSDGYHSSSSSSSSSSGDAVFDNSIDPLYFDCDEIMGRPFFKETNYYHRKSKTFFCADSFWNYPSSSLPRHYGELQNVGVVHLCPKIPLPLTAAQLTDTAQLLRSPLPFSSRLWGLAMDRIYHPFYKAFMIKANGDSAEGRRRYLAVVDRILALDIEIIAPCHGDVIKGSALCSRLLRKHFLLA